MADFSRMAQRPDIKLDELFHADFRREIQEALFTMPKTTFWRDGLMASLDQGGVAVVLDAEAPMRPATWEQLMGRRPPDGDIPT